MLAVLGLLSPPGVQGCVCVEDGIGSNCSAAVGGGVPAREGVAAPLRRGKRPHGCAAGGCHGGRAGGALAELQGQDDRPVRVNEILQLCSGKAAAGDRNAAGAAVGHLTGHSAAGDGDLRRGVVDYAAHGAAVDGDGSASGAALRLDVLIAAALHGQAAGGILTLKDNGIPLGNSSVRKGDAAAPVDVDAPLVSGGGQAVHGQLCAIDHQGVPAAVGDLHVLQGHHSGVVDVQAVLGGTAAVKGHIPQRHLGAILKIEEAGAGAIVAGDRKCARLRPDGMAAAVQSQVLGQRQRSLAVDQARGVQLHVPEQPDGGALFRLGHRLRQGGILGAVDIRGVFRLDAVLPGPLRHGLDLPGGRRTKHPLRRLGIGRQHGGQQAQSQQSGNKFSLHVCRFLPIGL